MSGDGFLFLHTKLRFCEIISANKLQLNARSHTVTRTKRQQQRQSNRHKSVIRKRVKHNFLEHGACVVADATATVAAHSTGVVPASTAE